MTAIDGLAMYDQTQIQPQIDIEQYAPLVKRIAHHMMMRMPASVQVEDLIQAGMVGLIEASQKYDASKGASFETYAGIRIRGSIVDEMRRGDWAPRSVHRNARKVQDAIAQVEAKTGRDATDQEVADHLEVSLEEYHSILQDSTSTRLFSYEEAVGDDDSRIVQDSNTQANQSPYSGLQKNNLRKCLADAIKSLPEREQLVLALYYDEELNLKEIGQILGVSESRVSQIHSQAALRLRGRLKEWDPEN